MAKTKESLGLGAFFTVQPLALAKTMRPLQWVKNGLVFLPFVFAIDVAWSTDDLGQVTDLLFRLVLVFLAFCAMSSAVYLLNDLLDRHSDRQHPVITRATEKRRQSRRTCLPRESGDNAEGREELVKSGGTKLKTLPHRPCDSLGVQPEMLQGEFFSGFRVQIFLDLFHFNIQPNQLAS